MRDILFKAKRIDNGEWVEGYYVYHIKRTICAFNDKVKAEDEQHVIMQDGFSDWNMPRDTVHYDINPDTLCQYTGLTDKNGKKIWENDIVKPDDTVTNEDYIIGWDKEMGAFVFCDINTNNSLYVLVAHYIESIQSVEVIGNIFDNPELLEVQTTKQVNKHIKKC